MQLPNQTMPNYLSDFPFYEQFRQGPFGLYFKRMKSIKQSLASSHSIMNPEDECKIDAVSKQSTNSKYKTVLCTNLEEKGFCQFGEGCIYAHGVEELRVKNVPTKYKTIKCEQFSKNGKCKYGARCNFIHCDDNELAISEKISVKTLKPKAKKIIYSCYDKSEVDA